VHGAADDADARAFECTAEQFCRRERRNRSTKKGSTRPLNSAAPAA